MRSVDPLRQYGLARSGAERGLLQARADLARTNEQFATGLRINRPSDDPGGFAQARALESLQQQHAGFARAAQSARLWNDRTMQELDRLDSLYQQAHEEGLRMRNGTYSAVDRAAAADRIEALRAEALDAMNARVGSDYLFAGTATGGRPFADDGTPAADLSGRILRRVGDGLDLQVNVSGATLAGPDGELLASLDAMAAALRASDADALTDAATRVEAQRDRLVGLGASAGAVGERLTTAEARLADAEVLLAARRSDIEDADFAQLALDFQQQQLTLEAALRATASLTQHTLLDYLR